MKKTALPLVLVLLIVIVSVGLAGAQEAPTRPEAVSQIEPGNYCLSCHTPGDARLLTATDWTGPIERETVSPCPALSEIHEQTYYTERLFLAVDRARADIPNRIDAGKTDARIAIAYETYNRLLDTPVDSLEATISEHQVLRFRLGKSYRWLTQTRESVRRWWVFIWAIGVSVVLLISLIWGWRNINRYKAGKGLRLRFSFKAVLFVILVFILFALPIFRIPAQEMESATAEEQARQTALDDAGRIADVANRALARSWMLGRVGAAWHTIDPAQAEEALGEALAAVEESQRNAPALWGQAQAVREGTVGSEIDREAAELVADRLNAANSRAWSLRLIAAEWATVDPQRAEALLQDALRLTMGQSDIYRELDVRGIAVTWATIDPVQGVAVAERVYDPAMRSWALREIALITEDSALFGRAAEAARQVEDPVEQARLLREIAVQSGEEALFAEAAGLLEGAHGLAHAYALSDLAAAAGDAELAEQIDPAYPGARAAAFYRLGRFEAAWSAAEQMADPFDQARAQAAIAGAWANADQAAQIHYPALRDRALRDAAINSEDLSLAQTIESPYYRVQALTALGDYEAALAAAEQLNDAYPLRELAVAWAEIDPETALEVVELMDREADKAVALRTIAQATGAEEDFDRALRLALAARVRGDNLAPAEASLELAQSFLPLDETKAGAAFNQAYDIAKGITVKYQ